MIDSLWFSRQKFARTLEGLDVNIPANVNLYDNTYGDMRVIQKFSGKAGTYKLTDKIVYYKIRYNNQDFYVKESDLKIQNGGVLNSSINRLYHAVSRLGRRLAWL